MTNNTTAIASHLMLFELSVGGHYPEYIAHLIKYWYDRRLWGKLSIVVSPEFMDKHATVVNLTQNQGDCKTSQRHRSVRFVPIDQAEADWLKPSRNSSQRMVRAFQEFKLLQKYAKLLQASQILVTYFDTRQFPLACRQRLLCPISGIYFRPRFHYGEFALEESSSIGEKLTLEKEKLLLSASLQHPQLTNLFCLDPFAAKHLARFSRRVNSLPLADPVDIDRELKIDATQLKTQLGIEPQRKVLLLFGALTKRKGILPLLDALCLLSPEITNRLCLFLVGSMDSEFKDRIASKIDRLTSSTSVQLVTQYEYVSETEIQQYFQLADVVLALYQRHVGMSGILIRAAAAQKPVLASNYGLMGEITRRYKLGIDLDAKDPQAIAKGLTEFLSHSPMTFADAHLMEQFATQNSAVNFASTIFQTLNIAPVVN